MVSTTEGITGTITMAEFVYDITNKTSERNPLHQFSDLFYSKWEPDYRRLGSANTNFKSTRKDN